MKYLNLFSIIALFAFPVSILASTDTYRTESGSQTITAGATIGNNAVQANAGYSESSNRASGTTHNNSNIAADNVIVKTGNAATFAGANVNADDKLAMNIGGNLNVESKQDTDYAKGNNCGVNAGAGNADNATGGFNVGSSNHDSAWVNDATELTGGNVDIAVGGKTTLTGAVIAANDDDELNLATNELEYNDLHDFNTSNERGFGVSTGIGISTDKGQTNLHPQGSTTISAKHTGSDTEQTTHATIGAGNITVGGDTNPELAGLNRDTDKVQEITKDQITGALDASMTVDNRVFSKSGREQIAKQHEDFVDNVEQIGDGLRNNIVTKSIENAITDDTKNIVDTIGDYIEQDRQMTELQEKHQDLVKALNGLTNYDSAEARDVLQQVADFVAGKDGFSGDLQLASVDGNVIGFAYQSNDGSVKNISLNMANIDMSDPNALMNALYHETTNFEQHTNNEQTAKNRGNTGAGIFDLKNYGNENTNTMDNGQWLSNYGNSETIQNGSLSLVSDAVNSSLGNGTAAPAFGEIAVPLAGAGCIGTGIGCPIGATIGVATGLAIEGLVLMGVTSGLVYVANKVAEEEKAILPEPVLGAGYSTSSAGYTNVDSDEKDASNKNNQKKSTTNTEKNNTTKQKLKYEPADYHHQNSSGVKSKAPTNPEKSLNDSIQIKDTSPRRISVDSKTGEIDIFDSTNNGTYHGHQRQWNELTQEMKNVLIKAGKANSKGVIIQ